VAVQRRSFRDEQRRSLGQNFLSRERAEALVSAAGVRPGELVLEIGPGRGALTRALAARGADVVAVELDPIWAAQLRGQLRGDGAERVRVIHADFLTFRLPERAFRVVASIPFAQTTEVLRRLLDDPRAPLQRADLVVQWEVARKRAASPPSTLLSTAWAPWWEFALGARIPARDFRPEPAVDGGVLTITRRASPLLPPAMASAFAGFVRSRWPF
jgi:23S rRNA (adenine-N6)-dimethyltransferase